MCSTFSFFLDFGANGDGATDNVKPFQNSLHAASAGGIGKSIMINVYRLIICCNMRRFNY